MAESIAEPSYPGLSKSTKRLKFIKRSLLYGPPQVGTYASTKTCVIYTRIWKHARSGQGYFLDISKLPQYTTIQHMQALHEQYKEIGVSLILGKNGQKYLELYPDPSIVQKFSVDGLYFKDIDTKLIPCKAIEGSGLVLNLSLLRLPFLQPNRLAAGLQATLQQYGAVLDIGQYLQCKTEFFMGEGYAVLYFINSTDYKNISHTLPFGTDDYFYITYPNMNIWCRYCHEDGHTKLDCTKKLINMMCYGCDEYGHLRKNCPRLKKVTKTNKTFIKVEK